MDARKEGATVLGLEDGAITVDSPVPFKLATLRTKIEAAKPTQPSKQDSHFKNSTFLWLMLVLSFS